MKPRTLCACLTMAIAALLGTVRGSAQVAPAPDYKAVAIDAAKWIRNARVGTPFGAAWPADPRNPKTVSTSLYSGSAGVVLFLLELYQSTGDAGYLQDARRGADDLLTKIGSEPQSGLYDGVAGIGFTLGETWRATKDDKYRRAAVAAVHALEQHARPAGRGVQWNSKNDIISGGPGIGLFLLYADQTLHAPGAQALAVRAGDRLIDLGEPSSGGVRWTDPSLPRVIPNFAHGTAGSAYFLATLFKATKEPRFLDAAYAGARYLRAVAKTDGDACLVFHDQPDNPGLLNLGWCHGPGGTARLFYQLYTITRDDTWMARVKMSANGILKSGIPEQRTAGFWNNVSQCCGNAGVAQFFLDLSNVTNDPRYVDFAARMTADLLARATRDAAGTRWVQADNRTEPDVLVAQTGYMQGAAGIGTWLLRLDAAQHQRAAFVRFPDSPWP